MGFVRKKKKEAAKLHLTMAFDNSVSIPAKTPLRGCHMALSRHTVPLGHSPFVSSREQEALLQHRLPPFPGPAAMVTATAFGGLGGNYFQHGLWRSHQFISISVPVV